MDKPFAILQDWVKEGRIHLSPQPVIGEEPREFLIEPLPDGLSDDELFEHAMKGVKSLGWSLVPLQNRPPVEIQPQDEEQDALRALEQFVQNGNVDIQQTGEYIEGSVHPGGRLYLDEFLLESVRAGFTCVRVIHGRGRHSNQHHPVLKDNVQRWLCTRRMSRHVIAYTSARNCDGGGGAVYVLLRK